MAVCICLLASAAGRRMDRPASGTSGGDGDGVAAGDRGRARGRASQRSNGRALGLGFAGPSCSAGFGASAARSRTAAMIAASPMTRALVARLQPCRALRTAGFVTTLTAEDARADGRGPGAAGESPRHRSAKAPTTVGSSGAGRRMLAAWRRQAPRPGRACGWRRSPASGRGRPRAAPRIGRRSVGRRHRSRQGREHRPIEWGPEIRGQRRDRWYGSRACLHQLVEAGRPREAADP